MVTYKFKIYKADVIDNIEQVSYVKIRNVVDNVYINPLKNVSKNIQNCGFEDDTIIVNGQWFGYAPGTICRFIQNSIAGRIPSFNLLESKIYKDKHKLNPDCKHIYVIETVLNILKGN